MVALHKTNGLWIQITHNVPAGEGGGVPLHIPSTSEHWGLNGIQNVFIMWGVQIGVCLSESLGGFAFSQCSLYRGGEP
jgi:hypothetical protein